MIDLDDYDGPWSVPYRPCTCGTWDWLHEPGCGTDDEDPDDATLREWQDTHDAPPEED